MSLLRAGGLLALLAICGGCHKPSEESSVYARHLEELHRGFVSRDRKLTWSKPDAAEREAIDAQLHRLKERLVALERQQKRNVPAQQICFELDWLVGKTNDFGRMRERLSALSRALDAPANSAAVDEQSPGDGSLGAIGTPRMGLQARCELGARGGASGAGTNARIIPCDSSIGSIPRTN